VAGIVDRVNVMYAGHVVESAGVDAVFHDPRHPYTDGLMGSIPRMDRPRRDRLQAIRGVPPDLIEPPPGCAFQPRCPYAIERCATEAPQLLAVAPDHRSACWVDLTTVPRAATA
jgi:oligopeptide transport system ATP-binding protein